MLPITSFLSCTEPIDQFECFSTRQKHHAKTYVTGLVAASNKTVQDISTIVLPAKSERALNKFLTEYDWDENQLNRERLALLQQADDTRWSSEGVVIIDDTFTHKTGKKIPHAGKYYDHGIHSYIWGQNIVYALYADEKTTYPLGFRLYKKHDKRRIELAIELVDELISKGTGKSGFQPSKAIHALLMVVSESVSMRWLSASTQCHEQSTEIPTTSGHRNVMSAVSEK